MALSRSTGLILLAIFLVWTAAKAPSSAIAQQQYNNTDGYSCNGRDRTCSTYALYRTFQAQESLQKVGSYFNMNPTTIANVSDMTMVATNAVLPQGQALYIPLDCSCQNETSQMILSHTIAFNDTFWWLSITIYGDLTKYQAMMNFNPTKDIYNLTLGDTIEVPIFCACPTVEQIANGTKFLLSYAVYPDETLDVISGYFGIATGELSAANQLAPNATLEQNTTLVVPLVSLPPIRTINFLQTGKPSVTNPSTSNSSERKKAGIIAGTSAGAVAALLVFGFIARHRKKAFYRKQGELSLVDQNLVPRMFTYRELSKATKNFSRSELLGRGGFGAVYKGTLYSGTPVAVKRIRNESKQGKESFQAEVTTLSHIRHRNLVQLRGWCHDEEQLLLVYDYMCNGSLDEWLFRSLKQNGEEPLTLDENEALPLSLRHSVLSGVAVSLAYLHEECAQCVLHRDIKSSNVLLDGHWNAYLGDFGLARLIDHQKMEKTTMMAGTYGYIAPEMPYTGKATKESDVYSFGVLMLEVMCGTRALDMSAIERGDGTLVNRVWQAHEAGNIMQVADSRLEAFPPTDEDPSGSSSVIKMQEAVSILITNATYAVDSSAISSPDDAMEEKKLIRNLLHLGLLCCSPNPGDRPSMRLVSQLLQFSENMEMSLPRLSSYKPQSHFFRKQVAIPSSSWSSFKVPIVQTAAEGSSQSTHSSSSVWTSGEPAHNMQTSFAAPDSSVVFSGR